MAAVPAPQLLKQELPMKNKIESRADDDLSHLQEGVCLICGNAAAPAGEAHGRSVAEYLHELGWHSWLSGSRPERNQCHEVLLRICPGCLALPRAVTSTIRERHGLAHMVDWLRSMGAAQ
jgi:hypothetical protein